MKNFLNSLSPLLPYVFFLVVGVILFKKLKNIGKNGGSSVGKTEDGLTLSEIEDEHPTKGVVSGKTSDGVTIYEAGPRISESKAKEVADKISHCIYDSFWHEDDRGIFDALFNAPIKCVSDWNLIVRKYGIQSGKRGLAYDLPTALKEYLDSNYYSELDNLYHEKISGWRGFV